MTITEVASSPCREELAALDSQNDASGETRAAIRETAARARARRATVLTRSSESDSRVAAHPDRHPARHPAAPRTRPARTHTAVSHRPPESLDKEPVLSLLESHARGDRVKERVKHASRCLPKPTAIGDEDQRSRDCVE